MEDENRIAAVIRDRDANRQRVADADSAAQQIAQQYKARAQQARSALEGMVAPLLGKSEVTQEDLDLGANYVDKADENRRRLAAIKLAPSLDHELIAKLPLDMQAELRAAFAAGGAGGMQTLIQDMLGANAGLGDFRLYNADQIADTIANQLAEAAAKKDLLAVVMQKLSARGIDPNNPLVQRALGMPVPEGATADTMRGSLWTAQSVNAGRPMADAMSDELQNAKISSPLALAIENDRAALQKVAAKAANIFGAAFAETLGSDDFGWGNRFTAQLQKHFDGRYIRIFTGVVE
jgi:hypothetical protein